MRTVGPNTLVNIKNMSSDVIAKIKETEARDMINVTDAMRVNEKIIKTKNLIFNPRSRLEWRTPETPHNENYVILAAEKLILNAPNAADDIALLKLIAPKAKDDLKGEGGTTGPEGWTSGHDDGRDGGPGNPGGTGHPGKTYDWPIIYMVFQELVVNSANPAILSALRVEGHGVAGGDGGRGGQGGVGGHGSRGTPGARKCVSLLPICGCASGPGRGGSGGAGGPGGRGGDAGAGGSGASISFVAPANQQPKLDRVQIAIAGGPAGEPGQGGLPGAGGREGGGGSKPLECAEGGGNGKPGPAPTPVNFGPGSERAEGSSGILHLTSRDNADLF